MSENPKNYIYTENYEMKIKEKKKSKMLLFYNHNLQSDTCYNSDIPHFFISRDKYLIIDRKIV